VLTREQGPQLEAVELDPKAPGTVLDLGLERFVALLAGEFGERLEIADLLLESLDLVMSSRTCASSVVTLRAASASSQRSGRLASASSSSSRTRASAMRR